MRRRLSLAAPALGAVLAAVAAGTGCGADFDPYERLGSLRILAIKSDPVAPAPGETTTLSALVYSPWTSDSDETPVPFTYEWSWCPLVGAANDGYPCVVIDKIPLGQQDTAQLTHDLDPAMLKKFCMGAEGLPLAPNCRDGFPATVRLIVSSPGVEPIEAVRTLRLRLDADDQGNNNPTLGPLHALVKADATNSQPPAMDVVLDESGTRTLVRKRDNQITAEGNVADAETYKGLDDNLQLATLTERLYASWFVESGDLDRPRTSYNQPTGFPFENLLKNKWNPERTKVYPRTTAWLYVVLRDNRDGVSWTRAKVKLEGP